MGKLSENYSFLGGLEVSNILFFFLINCLVNDPNINCLHLAIGTVPWGNATLNISTLQTLITNHIKLPS